MAKRNALHAITYTKENRAILPGLRDALLQVDIDSDSSLADTFADAIGPYGVSLDTFDADMIDHLLRKFLPFSDFNLAQGAIPRSLSHIAGVYPEQVLNLMLERIRIENDRRNEHDWQYQALGIDHHAVSFHGVNGEVRQRLLTRCLTTYMTVNLSYDSAARLFWRIDPEGSDAAEVIVSSLENSDSDQIDKMKSLLIHAPRLRHHYEQLRDLAGSRAAATKTQQIIESWKDLIEGETATTTDDIGLIM